MTLDDAIDQFSRQTGLSVRLDAAGSCRLVFDGRSAVDIERGEGNLAYFHTAVGRLSGEDGADVCRMLLEANLFGRDTGRAVLALDGDLGEVVLFRTLDMAATDYSGFTGALEDFLARSRAWTERLKLGGGASRAAAPASHETFLRV